MTVTAIIPHWNRRDLLADLLADLRAQTRPPDRVLVVDNGSTDGSPEAARAWGADVLALPANAGFAVAVNQGIKSSGTSHVAVLNNDVRLAPDWLERVAQHAGQWFVCGKLMQPSGQTLDGSFDLLCRGACPWRAGSGRGDGPLWNQPRAVQLAPFTATLFRRELFDRAGLLDESFESYLEDVDFGLRCALAGCAGWYEPRAVAVHAGSATLGVWNRHTVRRIARNQLLLVARHYPPGWIRRYGWPVLVAQLLWGLLAMRHGAGAAWCAGKWQGIAALRRSPRRVVPHLDEVLRASEDELRTLQQATGFDWLWRLYFQLT